LIVQRFKRLFFNEKHKNIQNQRKITFNGTVRAIGETSVKNAKRFDKKWRFSLILRYFSER
jgi:hypothetical protein